MRLSFSKYHGTGNDFILIDDRSLVFPIDRSDLIASLCQRSQGVGADGLILWQPSIRADFRMRIFNADGKEAAMCGNGIRCLFDFVHRISPADSYLIETGSGCHLCQKDQDRIGVHLGVPHVQALHYPLCIEGVMWDIHVLNTGVPHGVIFVDDLASSQFLSVAQQIRFHPVFAPEGINVNWVQMKSPHTIAVRTYERGVGETMSCGTGAAAAAWMAAELFSVPSPIQICTADKHPLLEVRLSAKREIELWGSATHVFDGQLFIASEEMA